MKLAPIKETIQPIAIITFSFLITMLVVGMIAYANCAEAKLFIDNLLGRTIATANLGQA